MADVGRMAVQLSCNPGPLLKGLGNAARGVKGFGQAVGDSLDKITQAAMTNPFTGMIVAAMELKKVLDAVDIQGKVAGLVRSLKESAEIGMANIGQQSRLARQFDLTSEGAATLGAYMQLTGVDAGAMQHAMTRLDRTIGQAVAGMPEASRALRMIGMSAEELIAMPMDQRFGAINDRLVAFTNSSQRAAAANAIFGEGFGILLPAITRGSSAIDQARRMVGDFGTAATAEEARAVGQARRSVRVANVAAGMLAEGINNRLAGALSPLWEAWGLGWQKFYEAAAPMFMRVQDTITFIGGYVTSAVNGFKRGLEASGPAIENIKTLAVQTYEAFGLLLPVTGDWQTTLADTVEAGTRWAIEIIPPILSGIRLAIQMTGDWLNAIRTGVAATMDFTARMIDTQVEALQSLRGFVQSILTAAQQVPGSGLLGLDRVAATLEQESQAFSRFMADMATGARATAQMARDIRLGISTSTDEYRRLAQFQAVAANQLSRQAEAQRLIRQANFDAAEAWVQSMIDGADRVRQSIQSPLDVFEDRMGDLGTLSDWLEPDEFARATLGGIRQLEQALGATTERRFASGLEQGSAAAVSAINQFRSGGNDPQARVEALLERARQLQQLQLDEAREVTRQLEAVNRRLREEAGGFTEI